MKLSHTPGPWQWYWRIEDNEVNCGVFSEPFPGHAYSVARCPRYQTKEQWEADARLIAAAPELLQALRNFMPLPDEDAYKSEIGLFARNVLAKL